MNIPTPIVAIFADAQVLATRNGRRAVSFHELAQVAGGDFAEPAAPWSGADAILCAINELDLDTQTPHTLHTWASKAAQEGR